MTVSQFSRAITNLLQNWEACIPALGSTAWVPGTTAGTVVYHLLYCGLVSSEAALELSLFHPKGSFSAPPSRNV